MYVLLMVSSLFFVQIDEKVADRLWESSKILDELVQAPDGGIPKELLKRAECIAVIPAVKSAALGIGGRYGRGAAACRKNQGKGPWGPPSMISLSGGSFGIQLGGTSTDVVMLFMTPNSMKHLLRDKVTLGGDIGAAAGPKGRQAAAGTSASMRAEILTYARSRGLFAGVALNGAVLQPDKDANKNLYNREITAEDLLVKGTAAVPEPGRKFIETLTRTTSGN
ncbi:MAG: lipid-binding SYLF domain-containing protein [Acidobacteria bacterium]|nr:lipid-binding SYLF domain-containing protein [Acidobacteriota bacterium]